MIPTLPIGLREFSAGNDEWVLWADDTHRSSGRVDLKPRERSTVKITMQPHNLP